MKNNNINSLIVVKENDPTTALGIITMFDLLLLVYKLYSFLTLEHISNIISSEGVVYFLKNIENKKILNFKNIEIIKGDVVNPDYFVKLKEKIDVIYLDLLSQEKLSTIIKNCTIILRQNGFLILILNDKSPIDDNFGKQIHKIIINLKASFELIQEIDLSDFFKNSMMIILQKTD
jgi:fibrillarin-like rRNA methylase